MLNDRFGPWSTAFDAGSRLALSAFWKGRMTRLPAIAAGGAPPGRTRVLMCALVLFAAGLFPTLQSSNEAAEAVEPTLLASQPISEESLLGNAKLPVESQEIALEQAAIAEPDGSSKSAGEPKSDPLRAAIDGAIASLSRAQERNGSWASAQPSHAFRVGISGLAALALIQAGVKPDDTRLLRAADYLRDQRPQGTYELVVQTLALCALDRKAYAEMIQQNAIALEEGQQKAGPNSGSWGYGRGIGLPQGGGDNSNAEFAIWGLDAAARAGAKVRRTTWEAALAHWLRCQNRDGGWSYTSDGSSTGSMTAAGVVSVAICLSHLHGGEDLPSADEQFALDQGVAWLGRKFAVGHNPGAAGGQWLLYYALMFRRAAEMTRTDRFGDHDWRKEFADYFISQQNRQTGTWRGDAIEGNPVLATSLVLLSLVGVEPRPARDTTTRPDRE